ncbi:leucine-rich repeat protein [Leyella stercorea]|uniref:leucine-rich repeat protein n=1 Tax=Leyella stercorea TaxID=363265 RepID=UPI00267310F2|nr:leucine-rich repeat protein [Leyella stercorea]
MKRLHLTLIVALFLCTIAYANEKDIKVGGFHYRILNDNEVAVIGTEINDTVIRIPSTVSITNKQYAVVEIANKKPEKEGKNWAYYKNQDWGASTIDIIVPQSVKKIRAGAFYYNSFRKIYLPEEMECISPDAFYNCHIGYIRFPKHLRDFHKYAFEKSYIEKLDFRFTQYSNFDINWLGTIGKFDALFLPRSIEKLERTSGYYCDKILSAINSLILGIDGNTLKKSIEDYNIELFKKVTKLAIENIEKIDFKVSDNFPNLKEVYLADPIREIGNSAFCCSSSNSQLEKVYLNDNVEIIGDNAFRGNPKLSNIHFPQKLKSIGNDAFHGCKGLAHIDIPTSVTYIGFCAFWGTGIKNVKGLNSNIKYGMYGYKSDNPESPFMGTPFDEKFEKIQTTFSYMALGKIAKEIPQWQKKKEYETTEQWKQRVTAENQKNKVDEIVNQAKTEYIALHKPKTTKGTLGTYDADYGAYPVSIEGANTIYAKIPLEEAMQFKSNWSKVAMQPTYGIIDDNIAVTSCIFSLGKKSWKSTERTANDNLDYLSYDVPTLNVDLDGRTSVAPNTSPKKTIDNTIDKNIPQTASLQSNTFVIAIGNENYNLVPKVAFANNDMNIFAQYCQKTLGIPMQNIRKYKDATFGSMLSALNDIKEIANAYNGDMNVIFYYAGHGIPNEKDQTAYLLPTDADGKSTEVCFPLARLYKELGELNAKSVIVFMDACFSGAQRGNGMLASARGVAIKAKEQKPMGKLIVLTASSGEETAYPYNEKAHGLFTYFLLKKLNETKGKCSLGELSEYITTNVRRQSIVINRKPQTPAIIFSDSVKDEWMNYKLTK